MPNPSLKDLSLSREESNKGTKLLAKERGIKRYENMSGDKLLSALKATENEKNFDKTRTKKIREKVKKLQYEFSKSEIKEIKKNLYKIENKKSFSASKEAKTYLLKLEEKLCRLKNYYEYDDAEYKGIKDVKDLFDSPMDEDYYKPIIVNGAFSNNYIQCESRGNKVKILTLNEYLDIIRAYLRDMINDHKTQSEWKTQLTVEINFISSKSDFDETHTMRTKSDNTEIMIGVKQMRLLGELFKSLLQRYQKGLEESMKGSYFTYDSMYALYYDLNKISLSRGKSYIDSPEWLKNKKARIKPKNNADKCFQYAVSKHRKQSTTNIKN